MTSKGDLTRHNIIDKSMNLFSVKGFFNTSIADIVQATGITKGGLYGHFKNKEEIWYAVYQECVRIWKKVVFAGVAEIPDPLECLDKVMENSLKNYLGGGVFEGGCFLLNSLVDLAGVAPVMSNHVLAGFTGFAGLLHRWLEEAENRGLIKEGLNLQEVANFMVISVNGAAPLYAASKDPVVWQHTLSQIRFYMQSLKK